jgi:hypothetical protein
MGKVEAKKKKSVPEEKRPGDLQESAVKPQGPSGDVAGVGNIEKIRDILFGVQMRDYDKRFVRIEERIAKETSDLRDDTKRRIDALEDFIKKELESLSNRIKDEQHERKEGNKGLSDELKTVSASFGKKMGQTQDQLDENTRALREQILDQTKHLSDEIHRKHEENALAYDRMTQQLRAEKVDRAALAELFTDMAMRLSDERAMELNLESLAVDDE